MAAPKKQKVSLRAKMLRLAAMIRRGWRVVLSLLPRAYSLAILLLVCWLTYRSVRYLVVSLLVPSSVPSQIAGLPTRLNESMLRTDRTAFPALEMSEVPRTPLSHYHRLDVWFEPDPKNDCTRSGCHAPLPHTKRKEVRAFLNMHATSIHCGVCHFDNRETPVSVGWYALDTGQLRGAPAILQAYGLLTSPEHAARVESPDPAFQGELANLLAAAAKEANHPSALGELADHVRAVRPGSKAFAQLLIAVRETLPKHFRGEYGTKLAVRSPSGDGLLLGHPQTDRFVESFLRRRDAIREPERSNLLKQIHPLKRPEPLTCSDCHRVEGSLIDFRAAGYPAARAAALYHPIVAQMIENINKGTPFKMPEFLSPRSEPQAPGETTDRNNPSQN
ncbi:MAG: hypothetical protein KF841_09020 [Phycisphaerae bacterium]|nr:hypothetical protein [Phycisphaerae bacterium]